MKTFAAALLATSVFGAQIKADMGSEQFFHGEETLVNQASIQTAAAAVDASGYFDQGGPDFMDTASFTSGVNLTADTMIAIEAIRLGINQIQVRYNGLKARHDQNVLDFTQLEKDIGETQTQADDTAGKIADNTTNIQNNTTRITTASGELDDLEADVAKVEQVLILFCHQFIYSTQLPEECVGVFKQANLTQYLGAEYVLPSWA